MSLAPVAEVPPAVVTVTSTVPVPDGELTVRVVELVTLTEVPAVDAEVDRGRRPRRSPVPVTVTGVPPAWGPLVGLTLVTVGGPL